MAMTQPPEQDEEMEQSKHETRNGRIGAQVIHILGKPDTLHDLQVLPLWEDHYRVNVFIGADAASAKIANSYFVKVDSDGDIVRSSPTITKQY